MYSCFNAQLEYLDTNTSLTTTISSSSSPTEPVEHLYFSPQRLDSITTAATVDSNSFSITDTGSITTASSSPPSFTSFHAPTASPPTHIASPRSSLFSSSFASIAIPSTSSSELNSSGAPNVNTEDVPCSTVAPDGLAEPQLEEPSLAVHYTFVDPHEKPRKRRSKGIKNSTPIACTFCRRRKIRCGGPQEGGVCKYVSSPLLSVSRIRLRLSPC